MISITAVLYMLIIISAAIGALRGWAKELLVTFSIVLALFVIIVMEKYVGFVQGMIESGGVETEFYFRMLILAVLTFFGYQTPRLQRLVDAARRERLQDSIMGSLLGAVNGFFIFGSVWAYLHKAEYFLDFIKSPEIGTPLGDAALALIEKMPPMWVDVPGIYVFVALAFIFVVIVYI